MSSPSARPTTTPRRAPSRAALPRSPLLMLLPVLLALLAGAAVAELPAGAPVFSDPLDFDNEFFPFQPGGVKVYIGRDEGEKTAVVDLYLQETRSFQLEGEPVECAVLQETEFEAGLIKEISLNYFAEADDGSVYYFGEVVDNYEDGEVVSHEGSWLVGGPTRESDPDDAATALVPALFMPADPEVGDQWKPEDLFPFVDETATVVAEEKKVSVYAGKFEGTLKVEETSALSTGVGTKWYAPGAGLVLDKAKNEKLQLVASTLQPAEEEEDAQP
jgi:hypothetical protein